MNETEQHNDYEADFSPLPPKKHTASISNTGNISNRKPRTTSDSGANSNYTPNYNILNALSRDFFDNIFLIERFLLFFLCVVLIILCIFYGIGQITSLELENYFCDNKDLSEIYQHSRDFNLTRGTTDGCWHSKGIIVNDKLLFSSSAQSTAADAYTLRYARSNSYTNIFKSIVFFIMAIWLLYCLVLYAFLFCKDCFVRFPTNYYHPRYE